MIRLIQNSIFLLTLLLSIEALGRDTNNIELHLQLYDQGVCFPLRTSQNYSTSKHQKVKYVFQCGSYYSTIHVYVESRDSADLQPQENHQFQSSSLKFNPKLKYKLVIVRTRGFGNTKPDSMVVLVEKLQQAAQVRISFKKGSYKLEKLDSFEKIKTNAAPNFTREAQFRMKKVLKLDSTAYYNNGEKKTEYYIYEKNFPFYYVQEFDSLNPLNIARGFRMLSQYKNPQLARPYQLSVWNNSDYSKYDYWEYYEGDRLVKHELWSSRLQQSFEWYPSGRLKSKIEWDNSNKLVKYSRYLESGLIKEKLIPTRGANTAEIEYYIYSSDGELVQINTYHSDGGMEKREMKRRSVFYPSGQLKMEEQFGRHYTIKYYNEDGTNRIH